MPAKSKEIIMHNSAAQHPAAEAWRQFTKTIPFLGVPPEIHLKIFTFLNPIDSVCLSLTKYVPSPAQNSLLADSPTANTCTEFHHVSRLNPTHSQSALRDPPSQLRNPKAASTASQSSITPIIASFIIICGASFQRSLISVGASVESIHYASRRVIATAMSIVGPVGSIIGDVMKGEDACWTC